ncbi:MAG: hypothetical protein KDC46_14580 [Thermoleophilia bacterium]|nr:hypothetical protein [Thermoleophilia bacterium]
MGVATPSAHAGYTEYWPSLNTGLSSCVSLSRGSISPGATKYRGNYGYNRNYSHLAVNGGSWSWGAAYTTGAATEATNSQQGGWSGFVGTDTQRQANPYLHNNNQVNVGAFGCLQFIG